MDNLTNEFLSLKRKLMEKYFEKMNDMQKKAIFSTNGPVLILAGAGSGKTTVLINRITNLIKYGCAYEDSKVPGFVDQKYIDEMKNCLDSNNNDKIEYTLKDLSVCPAKPWQILAITFTNKAANELKDRLEVALGTETGRDVFASTFHYIRY